MFKILSSSSMTFLLVLAMAAYLAQGKLLTRSLDPSVMFMFALALIVQGMLAILRRALILSGKIRIDMPRSSGKKVSLPCTMQVADTVLSKQGLAKEPNLHDGGIIYSRRRRPAQFLELAIYGSLIFSLVSGTVKYGYGISGAVDVGSRGEWFDLRKAPLEKGFFVGESEPGILLRASDISNASSSQPSAIVLEAKDADAGTVTSFNLKAGDSIRVRGVGIYYLGDIYLAFIKMLKGTHDYLPDILVLSKMPGIDDAKYRGMFLIGEPQRRGAGDLDPGTMTFSVRVLKNEMLEFEVSFPYGETGRTGDYEVYVPAMLHSGRFLINRHGDRTWIVGGMVLCVLFLFARAVLRPQYVIFWRKDEQDYFHASGRRLRKLLRQV